MGDEIEMANGENIALSYPTSHTPMSTEEENRALALELAEKKRALAESNRKIQSLQCELAAERRKKQYRLPFSFSVNPSRLRSSAVREVQDDSVSTCLGHPWALKALEAFYKKPEGIFLDAAKEILQIRKRKANAQDDQGIYSSKEPDCEEFYSSLISSRLQWHFGGEDRNWNHQFPVPLKIGSCFADTVCTVEVGTESLPCAVIEYGFTNQARDKLSQTCGYVVNLSHIMERRVIEHGLALVSVQWLMGYKEDRIALRVHGFPPISAANGRFSTMTVWEGKLDEKMLAAAFSVCYRFGDLMTDACTAAATPKWTRYGRNVAVDGKRNAFKIYDYRFCVRGEDIPECSRRSHKHYNLLPQGQLIEPQAPNLKVVRYKFIEGRHVAETVEHFRSAAIALLHLHSEKNLCHGDIRLANIVFTINGCAHFIDFDFSGTPYSAEYPDGFADKLEDGERHPDAKSGEYLQTEHDCFSFASCMLLHKGSDQRFKFTWDRLAAHVKNQKLQQFIDESKQYASQVLLCSENLEKVFEIGSPDRKPTRKHKPSSNSLK